MMAKLTDGEFQQFVVEHLEKMSAELSELRSEMEGEFASSREGTNRGLNEIHGVLGELRAALKEVHEDITQIGRVLKPLSDAFDKDAETIVELERRTARIEKHLEMSRT